MAVPKLLVTAALMAANMALTMSRTTEGPRLDDLKFTDGDYGASLPNVWGLRRLEVPIFWAEDLREVKKRSKTKGGKYNEYKYYGTWAVAVAGHEISSVSRIWFDTHLIYDLTGTGPVTPFNFGGSGAFQDYVSIYLGTSDQEADPRMQATVDAEFGAGSCPAYRDTAYIVFKDIPLEKLGNRIPQVSVEVVSNPTTPYPTDLITHSTSYWGPVISPDGTLALYSNGSGFRMFDLASNAEILTRNWTTGSSGGSGAIITAEGDIIYQGDFGYQGDIITEDIFGGASVLAGPGFSTALSNSALDADGASHWLANVNNMVVDGTTYPTISGASFICGTTDGELWIVNQATRNSSTEVDFYELSSIGAGPRFTVSGLSGVETNAPMIFHYSDASVNHFILGWGDYLYLIDRETGAINAGPVSPRYGSGVWQQGFDAIPIGASSFFIGFEEYDSSDLSLVRQLDRTDWWGGSDVDRPTVYDRLKHALIDGSNSTTSQYSYLDRVGDDGVTLETICNDVADLCGVEDYDFSDLDQIVTGWDATHGPGQNMVEPLLDVYDSDFRPAGFTIEGIKRTGVSTGGTLATAWFTGDPRYKVTMRQAAELPRAMLIDFADTDAEQQKNSVRVDRPLDATEARAEKRVDLSTLALNVDDARQLADRYFRRVWSERKEIENGLTAKELGLEPGDVRTLELDGSTVTARCTSLTIAADDKLTARWKFDAPTLATLVPAVGATFDGRDDPTVLVPMLTKGFVLDTALIEDADESSTPIVYALASPYAAGAWPGAVIYEKTGDEYTEEFASVSSTSDATWGLVEEAFAYANPNLWDRGTEITVTLQNGSLTSATESAINANPKLNLAAIGDDGRWELVQFSTATLDSGTTYTLSGFKRGRRGTEWAAELHGVNDKFVLLDVAEDEALGLSDVGTDLYYKPITAGRSDAGAFPFVVAFTGASLKPYAPAHVEAVKESNGDWTIYGTRRTRVGGAWTGGSSIPLGETSEAYSLDLGDGITTVTKTTTSLPYTWDVATQTSDTGGEVMAGNLEAAVYQVSASVGRGYGTEITA